MRRVVAVTVAAAALGATGAAVAHAVTARGVSLALPELHGQVTWAPGARTAPAVVPRGHTAVIALVARGCVDCLSELRFTLRRLPAGLRPAVVRGVAHGISLLLLVDRRGDIRAGYTFPFAPAFVEGDLRTLSR
jgi:hypothetical protein